MQYLYILAMSYGYRFFQVFEFSDFALDCLSFLNRMQWQVMWLTTYCLQCQKSIDSINLSVSVYFLKSGCSNKGNILNSFLELLN